MRNGREIELECPRCRVPATRRGARGARCTHCDAELVPARSPSEEWIRAYLYGDRVETRVRPLERLAPEADARPAAKVEAVAR